MESSRDKKIWICGGGQFAGSLPDTRLIDKLILKVNPVLIGEGIPLFGNSRTKVQLNLLDLNTFDCGIIVPAYHIEYE